ncbi:MAG: tetratricopeptide repeat protein, partial [Nitrososphaera sp.]|nr:tetratricopeptide repeat protein [Nitrososphaera sp.]
ALFRELGYKRGIAVSLNNLGLVARCQGDYERALMLHEESLALYQEVGDKSGIAACLEGLARVAGVQDQPERAAWLLGAAEALRETIGIPLPPSDQANYEHNVTSVRTKLGEEAFAAAWAKGRTMAQEQFGVGRASRD